MNDEMTAPQLRDSIQEMLSVLEAQVTAGVMEARYHCARQPSADTLRSALGMLRNMRRLTYNTLEMLGEKLSS